MDEEDVVHNSMEYYSAIKKNEIMPLAAAWIDLEVVILSEVGKTEKEKHCMTSFICGILNDTNELTKLKETENELIVAEENG